MKKFLLAGAALAMLSGAAVAADLPSRVAAPAPAPAPVPTFAAAPVFTWTGLYAGVQAGGIWGEDKTSLFFAGTPVDLGAGESFKHDVDGFTGGAQVGYNYQIGSVVVGLEGDVEFGDVNGDRAFSDIGAKIETNLTWQGSVRGRLGYAFDRSLVYGTAGVAFAEFDHVYSVTGLVTEKHTDTQWGWAVGAGAEHALTDYLVAGVEYRYTQFEKFDNVSVTASDLVAKQEPHFHAVKASVKYKF